MGTVQRKSKETDETFTLFFTIASPFSNFHPCKFSAVLDDKKEHKFCCVEQYYMYHKAMAAGNENAAKMILVEQVPRNIKKIGSDLDVADFQRWRLVAMQVMRQALYMKYENNVELRRLLFLTRGSTLAEASPTDCTWGIGVALESPEASERSRWRGRNQLGLILTAIREDLWYQAKYAEDKEYAELVMQREGFFDAFFQTSSRVPPEEHMERKRLRASFGDLLSLLSPRPVLKRPRISEGQIREEKRSRRDKSRSRSRSTSGERKRRREKDRHGTPSRSRRSRHHYDSDDDDDYSRSKRKKDRRSSHRNKDGDSRRSKRKESSKDKRKEEDDQESAKHARITFDLDNAPPPLQIEKSVTGQKRLLSLFQQEKKKLNMQQQQPPPPVFQYENQPSFPIAEPQPVPLLSASLFAQHFVNQPPNETLVNDDHYGEEYSLEEIPMSTITEVPYLDIPMPPDSPLPRVRRPQSRSPPPIDPSPSAHQMESTEINDEAEDEQKRVKKRRRRPSYSSSSSSSYDTYGSSSDDSFSSDSRHRSSRSKKKSRHGKKSSREDDYHRSEKKHKKDKSRSRKGERKHRR